MRKTFIHIILFLQCCTLGFVMATPLVDTPAILYGVAVVSGFAGMMAFRNMVIDMPVYRMILLSFFILIIFIPLTGKKETTTFEKRKLAAFPEWRWGNVWKFFFQYKSYFEDRFAYRNDMVAIINLTKFYLFNKSSIPDIVTVGRNNWLYMGRTDYVDATSKPFTEAQLDTAETNLEIITAYFKNRNMEFYFMIIPVKERIYPEYMKDVFVYRMTNSRREQLYDRIKNNPLLNVIDCRQELIDGKKIRDTYFSTDTHWNEFGAYLGYKKLFETLERDFPELVAHSEDDYRIDSTITTGGDLQEMMGFDHILTRKMYDYTLKNASKETDSAFFSPYYPGVAFNRVVPQSAPTRLNLFLTRDSFSEFMKKFITPHFDTTTMAWTPILPVGEIVKASPDIVVHEMLEMFSGFLMMLPPEIRQDTVFMQQHFPGYLDQSLTRSLKSE